MSVLSLTRYAISGIVSTMIKTELIDILTTPEELAEEFSIKPVREAIKRSESSPNGKNYRQEATHFIQQALEELPVEATDSESGYSKQYYSAVNKALENPTDHTSTVVAYLMEWGNFRRDHQREFMAGAFTKEASLTAEPQADPVRRNLRRLNNPSKFSSFKDASSKIHNPNAI